MLNKKSLVKYYEQLPPQHNLAEEIMLGGILLRSKVIEIAIKELVIESFALEAHQLIYRTIIDIYFEYHYIDSIILINTLWELNLLNEIGGINKILNLLRQGQVFISKDIKNTKIEYYIKLIQDKYFRRLLIQYGYDIVKLSYNTSISNETILFKTEKYINNIKNIFLNDTQTNITQRVTEILLQLKSNNYSQSHVGLQTGFKTLDKITSGFKNSDLIIIAGRPSMGKTSLSLNITFNLIQKYYQGICIFSLEMSKDQILYKLLSIASQISINKIRSRKINNKEWIKIQKAGNYIVNSKLYIDDTANLSMMNLKIKIATIQNESNPINLIIIDYLQLLNLNDKSITNRSEELASITRLLKILAKEFNIPIIVLSQLNRNVESRVNKRPLLSDLRESGCVDFKTQIIYNHSIYKLSKLNINSLLSNNSRYHHIAYANHFTIKQTKSQYIYQLQNYSNELLGLTHNHSILSYIGWQRNDQLKYYSKLLFRNINQNLTFDTYHDIKVVKLYKKSMMYDIEINERKFFCSNEMLYTHNSIEQDADLVLFLYRDAYYNENTNYNHVTDIIIAKHRNGPTGIAQLHFNPQFASFTNLD